MFYVPSDYKCALCGKQCKNANSYKQHFVRCDKNPNKIAYKAKGKPKGTIPWNKGLTEDTDSRVKKNALKVREYKKQNGSNWTGRKHTEETKQKISEKMSICNKGGRCKWYSVGDQLVQGTWERNIGEELNRRGIRWYKIKTNSHTLEYVMDGKKRHYTPDFYLPEHDLFLEIKGFWRGTDKQKMECVFEQHPDIKIVLIEKQLYERILDGELVW